LGAVRYLEFDQKWTMNSNTFIHVYSRTVAR